MKIIPSVLVSSMSGKAGGVVASNWKGIPYVRKRVIPANPDSLGEFGQNEHRARMRMLISWWHDLEDQLQAECKRLAQGLAMSGFNAFVRRNLTDLSRGTKENRKEADNARIMPLNAQVNPISTLTAETGTGANDVDLAWLQGEAVTGDQIYVLACEMTLEAFSLNLTMEHKEITNVEGLQVTLAMSMPEQKYGFFVLVEHVADSTFSVAAYADATSAAAA